jgi:hypothetical protein
MEENKKISRRGPYFKKQNSARDYKISEQNPKNSISFRGPERNCGKYKNPV